MDNGHIILTIDHFMLRIISLENNEQVEMNQEYHGINSILTFFSIIEFQIFNSLTNWLYFLMVLRYFYIMIKKDCWVYVDIYFIYTRMARDRNSQGCPYFSYHLSWMNLYYNNYARFILNLITYA